tara:strand:- start:11939 stop:14719 length:2781 start_codon:yes stop_codon:yes gene_type:complete
MLSFNAGYQTVNFNPVDPLTASSSVFSTDSIVDAALGTVVGTVAAVSTTSTANAISITGDTIRAHVGDGANPGVVQGISSDNTSLGNNTLSSLTTGTGNIALGENLGNLITDGVNNILIRGNVDSASAINRIAIGNTTSSTDNEFSVGDDITLITASGLASVASSKYLTYNAGVVQVSTEDAVLLQGSTMTGNIDAGGFAVANVANGTELQAVNKSYIDSHTAGLDPKESCNYATISNITNFTVQATVEAALDPVGAVAPTLVDNDRVLVRSQTDPLENGIYRWLAGTLSRAPDQDGTPVSEVSGGNFTFVQNGDTLENTGWVLQGYGVLTIGVDPLVWIQFSGSENVTASNVGAGAGIFRDKVGSTLNFRSINGAAGINVVENTDDITITPDTLLTGAGGDETLVVLGTAPNYSIKGLTSRSGISFTENANDIVINASADNGGNTSIFSRKTYCFEEPTNYPILSVTTVVMNTIEKNDIGIILDAGVFTLPAGSYLLNGSFPIQTATNNVLACLRDTDGTVYASGILINGSGTSTTAQKNLAFSSSFTLSATTTAQFTISTDDRRANVQEIKLEAGQLLSTVWNEQTASTASLLDFNNDGGNLVPAFNSANTYVAYVYSSAATQSYVGVYTTSPYAYVTSINFSANTFSDSPTKCGWGVNQPTILYLTAGDTLYAYSFNGATLTLEDSVVVEAFTGLSVNGASSTDDYIALGTLGARFYVYSFNGSIFALVANQVTTGAFTAVNSVDWSEDNTLCAVCGSITTNVAVEAYSWVEPTLTYIATSSTPSPGSALMINILPLNTYILVGSPIRAFSFDGATLTPVITTGTNVAYITDSSRSAYIGDLPTVADSITPLSVDILTAGGSLGVNTGRTSISVTNPALATARAGIGSNHLTWFGTNVVVISRMIYGDTLLRSVPANVTFTKL